MSRRVVSFCYNPETDEGRKIEEWIKAQDNLSIAIRRLILNFPTEEKSLEDKILEAVEKALQSSKAIVKTSSLPPKPLPDTKYTSAKPKKKQKGVTQFFT